MSTPTPWGRSSRHSACGSYLDVLTSPNQSLHSFAPSPAPGLIGRYSEVNLALSLCEGSVNDEPLSSGLTGFSWLSLGLYSAGVFLQGGLRVVSVRQEWTKELRRLPKTFCVSGMT